MLALIAALVGCDLFDAADNAQAPTRSNHGPTENRQDPVDTNQGPSDTKQSRQIPSSWIEFRVDDLFTFMAPPDLIEEQVQGIDSFIGRYRSDSLTVFFDHGPYSAFPACDSVYYEACTAEWIDLDARKTKFLRATFSGSSHFIAEVYVLAVGDIHADLNVVAIGFQKETQNVLELIVRSVDFIE